MKKILVNKKGMEMVQVGILIALAVGIGLIFKTQITTFINNTFSTLMNSGF
ncbi:Flp1 family type IVb pilin [Clostridium aminobutyricum]|uniref:Flp1 family type IVb pilin n=1 Tax=Clostridium aminobutyricum TaxID=33953 RepID=UPI001AD8E955|nr:Flp1 family type IVb pilin [Clostridium aminobutyricum]